jgi:predicted PurR-regulated permease PerM
LAARLEWLPMDFDSRSLRTVRTLIVVLAVIVALSVAADFFRPLALAILLAFLLTPLVRWIERSGLPRALSVTLALGALFTAIAAVVYVVGGQLASLADQLPAYQANVKAKLEGMRPEQGSTLEKAAVALTNIEASLHSAGDRGAVPVRIVSHPAFMTQLEHLLGPFEAALASAGVVLLLLLFILIEREDISDRIVQLVGWGKIGVTTKTLSQIGHRLSRYVLALALVNTGFGLAVMLGLWAIGLPYPAVWGALAGLLRFVPYVGTLVAFSLPELVSIAHFPAWTQPLLVFALFAFIELAANSIEPLVYGKSTGISPTGLLLGVLFWTWLWGGLGLLLANVLTVCLAVTGQSIPALGFLGILLRRDVEIGDDLRFYQRVLNRDQDAASSLLEDALKVQPFEEVCDRIVIPTLARTEQDHAQGFIEKNDVAFIYRVVRDWLDEISDHGSLSSPASPSASRDNGGITSIRDVPGSERFSVIGVASGGGEALILRMVNLLLAPSGLRITILAASGSPLRVSDRVARFHPKLLLFSHLPPEGLTRARYLIKRLRTRHANIPLAVGYWDTTADVSRVNEVLRSVSVQKVVLSVAAARTLILERAVPEPVPSASGD